ncbi:MAG: PAS domain S-box protein [Ignavibacteria bacterium]|jgi:PAS domain S-box-containing protein|nr:PAS domain S-box protein [Ignavibacteria bacterium]MCU7519569.1 PAS domain S-box protein [Ignavibacteria bacterium]
MSQDLHNLSSPEKTLGFLEEAPAGILIFSSGWEVTYVNKTFFEFGVLDQDSARIPAGKNLLDSAIPQLLDIAGEITGLEEGKFFEKKIKSMRAIDGSEISVFVKGSSMYTGGVFQGGMLLLQDLRLEAKSPDDINFEDTLLNGIIKQSGNSCFITGYDLKIKYFHLNSLVQRILPEGDLINRGAEEVLYPLLKQKTTQILNLLMANKEKVTEKVSLELDGQRVSFQASFIPFSITGTPRLIYISLKDITSEENENLRRQYELNELKQYQFITSSVTDAVITTDKKGNIIFWNKSAEELFGYCKSEIYKLFIGRIFHSFDEENFIQIKNELLPGSSYETELRAEAKDKKEEYVSVKVSATGEANDTAYIFLCSSIKERLRVERDLRISEERFRNIVINANEFICNLDTDGNIIYVNPAFLKIFDYTEGELLQKNIRDLIYPGSLTEEGLKLSSLLDSQSGPSELSLVTRTGEKIVTLANFSPIMDLNDTVKYHNCIFTDITEQKLAQKELQMVRSVYEASQDGISVEADRKFILVNESFAGIFGYGSASELIGKDSLDIVANEDIPKVAKFIKARENKEPAPDRYEFLARHKDGSVFYAEVSVTSYEAENKTHIVSVCRDVTERKRTQQALKDSEERYRSITDNIDDFLWTAERIDRNMRPVFYTSSIEKVTGYGQEEFLSDSKLWFKLIYPDDLKTVNKKLKNLLQDPARQSDEIEFRIINKSGNITWVRNKIKVKRDSMGLPQRIFGLVSDISLYKKASEDLEKVTEALRESNDTKDKFLSIISHDLRTPFSSILGFTDLLLSDEGLSEVQRTQYITFIQESSKNMLALVNSLLDWTRLQTGRMKFEPERLNIREVIQKSITIMAGTALQKGIRLEMLLEQDTYVHADQNLLLQVFNNLISNSIKFTNSGGSISVSGRPGKGLTNYHFIVKDTGVGIKKEDLGKLFHVDSKFTLEGTKGEKGSGLGLSIVREIIEKHGGEIYVESEFGKGSEFHFTLPAAAANILLVDDNKTDRLLYQKILKNIVPNYIIDEASNGEEALEIIVRKTPALVITDHSMPLMSGYDMVRNLNGMDIKGKPPVIVLSGDINKHIFEEYRELQVEYIFQKPVDLTNFKTAIERSLRKALFY